MSLSSYEFIFLFLPLTLAGFRLCLLVSRNVATGWLIIASTVFYCWSGLDGLIVVVPSVIIDYFIAAALLRDTQRAARNFLFVTGVALNVLLLSYFKYRGFFVDATESLFDVHSNFLQILMPLGLSFLIFQKISFLADVRSGQVHEVRLLDYLCFASFFPRTIAGPIVRYNEIVPQFQGGASRDWAADLAGGIFLFSIGLFKKAVIADTLAEFVDPAFGDGLPPACITAWVGVLAYTFQLYFDFSGYTDMAMGAARMFGVRLPMNFNSPFKATNIIEFWGRWHITLTRFLTSYIYNPTMMYLTRSRIKRNKPVLLGKRSSASAIVVLVGAPTLITMLISGLWHGVGLQFIAWGALHGVYLTVNQAWRMVRPRFWPDLHTYDQIMKPVGLVMTFLCVVSALVFFRASSVSSALAILGGMIGVNGLMPYQYGLLHHLSDSVSWAAITSIQPAASLVWIVTLFFVVMTLPNSLELLRMLNFYNDSSEEAYESAMPQKRESYFGFPMRRLAELTKPIAVITSMLFLFGVLSLSGGGRFIYAQF